MGMHIGASVGKFIRGEEHVDRAFLSKFVSNTGAALGCGITGLIVMGDPSKISKPDTIGVIVLGLLACNFAADAAGSVLAWLDPEVMDAKEYSALSNQKTNEVIKSVAKLAFGTMALYGLNSLRTAPALLRLLK